MQILCSVTMYVTLEACMFALSLVIASEEPVCSDCVIWLNLLCSLLLTSLKTLICALQRLWMTCQKHHHSCYDWALTWPAIHTTRWSSQSRGWNRPIGKQLHLTSSKIRCWQMMSTDGSQWITEQMYKRHMISHVMYLQPVHDVNGDPVVYCTQYAK